MKEKFVFVLPSRDLVGYRIFLSLVVDQHNLMVHRALSSQLSSGSALICRHVNRTFFLGSSSGSWWVLPRLLPAHHILLAVTSTTGGTNVFSFIYLLITDPWHCNKRRLSWAGVEFVPFRGVVQGMWPRAVLGVGYSSCQLPNPAKCASPVFQFQLLVVPFIFIWDNSQLSPAILKLNE